MAAATLLSFNAFLTERLTAAAVDIYGFVEKTVVEYQEEVYRAQRENQRLQRLLDLLYQPEIRLHRADARPSVPTSSAEESPEQPAVSSAESRRSEVKVEQQEEQEEELWTTSSKEQEDDGDALTRELIKTVQQLEDCRVAEEGRVPPQTSVGHPTPPEEKTTTTTTTTTLYRCHICNYIFTKKMVLTWHLKMHENNAKDGRANFVCHICGKHIPCQSNLQNHMRVHTGERPYSCHYCGKGFKLKGHMTEHLRTHTGEKPFRCHVCGRSFNRGSTLRKHVLARHKEERPYRCDHCHELFTEKLLMKRHIRKIHSNSQSPA